MFESISYADAGVLALAVYGVAQVVARLTPSKKDDEVVSKVGKLLNLLFRKNITR